MSYTNHNILPRALSYEEKENRKKGIYDSFANYLVYCPKCKHVAKTNMYIQRAEAYIDELHARHRLPQVRRQRLDARLSPRNAHGLCEVLVSTTNLRLWREM